MENRLKLGMIAALVLGGWLGVGGMAYSVPNKGFEALTVNTKAVQLHLQKKYREAIDCYEQALVLFKEVYGGEHIFVTTTLNNIGDAWSSLGEYRKALDYYERLLIIDRKIYGSQHRYVATDLNNIGNTWKNLGEYHKAADCLNEALSIRKALYGEDDPFTKSTRKSLAEVQAKLQEANN